MRRRSLFIFIRAAATAWQFAAISQFDGSAMAVEAVTATRAVMVYGSFGACNGVVLAQDLVLTAAHCVVGRADFKIAGLIDDTLYSLADVAAAEPHPKYIAATAPAPVTVPDMALLSLVKPLPLPFGPALLATRKVAIGDRVEVVGRTAPWGGRSTESAGMAVFSVRRVDSHMLVLDNQPGYGEVNRLGGCYGFSGSPVFAIRTGVPLLAGIVRGGFCGDSIFVTPIPPFRDWLAKTAKRLGSPLAE
ncbi:MAG: trypsin-like serine protease [Xanthobacteraceae bacterium]